MAITEAVTKSGKRIFPHGRHDTPELLGGIGQIDWRDGRVTPIYQSLRYTLELARDEMLPRDILMSYGEITQDNRADVNLDSALVAVLYHLQIQWYIASGKVVPAKVTTRFEQALKEAKVARKREAAEAAEAGDAPKKGLSNRITIKTVAENALRQGKTLEEVEAEVKAQFPNSKFDRKHALYYRHFMVKRGEMEKPAREPRKAKENGEAETAAPAKAKASAKATPAKAKPTRRAAAR